MKRPLSRLRLTPRGRLRRNVVLLLLLPLALLLVLRPCFTHQAALERLQSRFHFGPVDAAQWYPEEAIYALRYDRWYAVCSLERQPFFLGHTWRPDARGLIAAPVEDAPLSVCGIHYDLFFGLCSDPAIESVRITCTARLIKHEHPNAKVVFIGPCAAKKLEAMRKSVRSEVDFVLTFEEMAGIFAAKHVDLTTIEEDPDGVNDASTDGRSFAVGGGVAKAVVNVIQHRYPGREVKVTSSQGLRECRKMMQEAVAGKYPGYLLEGMACPGGCVAGAGTMQPIKKSQAAVGLYARQAKHKTSDETEHIKELDKLVD